MKQIDILRRAKDYLNQIDAFTDPLTGKSLPNDSVFRDAAVRRSLYFAAKSLGWIIAYDNDEARLPFAPDPNLRKWVKAKERNLGVKDMIALLNWTRDTASNYGLTLPVLKEYLVERGYLRLVGEKHTVTPAGIQAGFRNYQGDYGPTVLFAPSAQQLLLDSLDDLSDYCKVHRPEPVQRKRRVKIEDREVLRSNLQVVRALRDGLHPVTGQALSPSDPAAQERMKTCFSYVVRALERALELGYFSAREPFRLSRKKWSGLLPSAEACMLTEFLQMVNGTLDDSTTIQPMGFQELYHLLEAEGLTTQEPAATGRTRLAPTAKGEALGIAYQERTNEKGEPYQILVYSPEVQRLLIAKLEQFVRDE